MSIDYLTQFLEEYNELMYLVNRIGITGQMNIIGQHPPITYHQTNDVYFIIHIPTYGVISMGRYCFSKEKDDETIHYWLPNETKSMNIDEYNAARETMDHVRNTYERMLCCITIGY